MLDGIERRRACSRLGGSGNRSMVFTHPVNTG